jgi:hypothetical protein
LVVFRIVGPPSRAIYNRFTHGDRQAVVVIVGRAIVLGVGNADVQFRRKGNGIGGGKAWILVGALNPLSTLGLHLVPEIASAISDNCGAALVRCGIVTAKITHRRGMADLIGAVPIPCTTIGRGRGFATIVANIK